MRQPHKMVKYKQFDGKSLRVVWLCLTVLWGWCLNGKRPFLRLFLSYDFVARQPIETERSLQL